MFNNKTILITGGTGSFGTKFTKHLLANYKPKKIIIYSRDEFKQYNMQVELGGDKFKCLRFFLGDVRDRERLNLAMREVDYVIHAAALKQVPAAEYNPMEFVKTNIYGAENIVYAAIQNNVKKIIALSTDKASNPINLYGSTKLVSDKIFISANNIVGKSKIIFSVVRYGNVAGSRGSVIPLFNRIKKNKEKYFPITDFNMTRFWITLDQGVKFVDLCMKKMKGSEIFIPIIPSVRIVDLAKSFSTKIKLKKTGIRPGEKIHETLCPRESSHLTYKFKNFYVIFSNNEFGNLGKLKRFGEIGIQTMKDFEYNSGSNQDFLSIDQIRKINKNILNDTL